MNLNYFYKNAIIRIDECYFGSNSDIINGHPCMYYMSVKGEKLREEINVGK